MLIWTDWTAELILLSHCDERYTRYSDRLHDFSVTIPRCYKDVFVNSFFLPQRILEFFAQAIEKAFQCDFFMTEVPII